MSAAEFRNVQYDNLVLLIDNDNADQEIFRRAYEQKDHGAELMIVSSGAEAIDMLKTAYRGGALAGGRRPGLILLDLDMPDMDGFATLTAIRNIDEAKLVPVVVFSTSRYPHDIVQCYRLGANCYIPKPNSFDAYVRVINEIESYWFSTVILPSSVL